MKDNFPGYYRPTGAEFDELWRDSLFIFDANVLLNIYGYTKRTRKILISIIEAASERAWMPHQFAFEYQKNRAKAILEQAENYGSVKKDLTKIIDSFKSKRRHPHVSKESVKAIESVCGELAKGEQEHLKLLSVDPFYDAITAAFKGKIGTSYDKESLQQIYADGKVRFENKVPPGFADEKKLEPDCYGDLVGWLQIIDEAKRRSQSVIFITDDRKDDWWFIKSSRTIGPRPDLVGEFIQSVGKNFYMYQLDQFMAHAKKIINKDVPKEALAEVRETREAATGGKVSLKALPLKSDTLIEDLKPASPPGEEKKSSV
jgi:hypothetical protein